ncbi:hypothetical protein [Weizmannia acidilactici]|uniref:hypothetical protein n=1 Tax=Weizmannia acidilactici TaxID=2607726 RepID=UPI001562A62D|nr:hypothetical protein [Weizmannia acidilactici]
MRKLIDNHKTIDDGKSGSPPRQLWLLWNRRIETNSPNAAGLKTGFRAANKCFEPMQPV